MSTKKKPVVKGVAVDAFIKRIDYAAQIREGVKTLLNDTLMAEHDFRSSLNIPADRFRRAVDTGEFDANQVTHQGKTYWSTVANVNKVRKMQEVYR